MKTDDFNATGTFVDGKFKTFDELEAEQAKPKPKPTKSKKTESKEPTEADESED
jgi:hypothetical protein